MIYRCPNNCTVSDEYKRCPRCDKWLLRDGDSREEAEKKTKEIQIDKARNHGKWNDK